MNSTQSVPVPTTNRAVKETPTTVVLSRWVDPLLDKLGHDPRSRYVERFWLPVLGPSTVVFVRHCADQLDNAGNGARAMVELELEAIAHHLGLGHKGGRNSALTRTILRSCRFGAARAGRGNHLELRRGVPPLNRTQVNHLPKSLQVEHRRFVEHHPRNDEATDNRVRRLALGLIECGDTITVAEGQLASWNVPPAVAADAVRWAWSHHIRSLEQSPREHGPTAA
ncbi:MAG: hypothetical protein HOM37_04595 [Acidimicrobiaceae bacterium]|nr:hypothetical protein [Acidimicrobiaceae bacterium]